ncbi:MAG TPA: outer membrane protein assembly factor BamA [Gemmatimonadaceae bacterium]|nr:outer membrane protein assembly factor BamA [Gemmatimonadaceae bacterium]
MQRLSSLLLFAFLAVSSSASAQDGTGPCSRPDSIDVRGNARVSTEQIRGTAGMMPRTQVGYLDVQRAIRGLFQTGQFDDVTLDCVLDASQRATLVIAVRERPILADFTVAGVDRISARDVRERLELPAGQPLDPARVAYALARADSLYESRGYYLARITPETTFVDDRIRIRYVVDEGRRLAVSGIRIVGNEQLSDADIVGVMKTKPEGFLFTRKGEFNEIEFAQDLSERIPGLYGSRGFIDFRVISDTLIVDRERGKGLVELHVSEGPRYTIGGFEILGNRRFPTDALREYYPFGDDGPTIAERTIALLRRPHRNPPNTFDLGRWEEAHEKIMEAYSNEGYIYARVNPIVERVPGEGLVRTVNLRWEIEERSPAIINRIDIAGNDYTSETCIREQLVIIPGQVFNRNALIRSYQNISNLNFFETPLPAPDTRQAGEEGDVDIVFNVKEKRTGSLNFGASMGQGTGLGGFIGVDQPNLFGRCKRAQVNWQFGRYINDFQGTYSDPNIRQSRISGSITGYHTRSRFRIADLGQSTRTGGQLQFGFPVPRSFYSRIFVSYGGEAVRYKDENETLLGSLTTGGCSNCFRSTLGLTGTHDTRIGLPFATDGGLQTFSAQFNGGPLGGTSDFQRYTTDLRSYAPLASFGNPVFTGQPIELVFGLSARAGAVFGDPGPFFYSQAFTVGGTQFGEQLRGYEEFSITPSGFDPTAGETSAKRGSFGNSYFTGTAELGLRLSQMLYLHTFFEGGNVWHTPRAFNPTRLFRSVGVGAAVISPLGPIGLDLGYALDRVNNLGERDPGWKLHFKLGQLF